ncbi:MAG: ABC transporter substrate-binding protein [Chloroflexi bacterium]|nr:ABC transporter substrate-binding protein [Chloroflexota bacterium]
MTLRLWVLTPALVALVLLVAIACRAQEAAPAKAPAATTGAPAAPAAPAAQAPTPAPAAPAPAVVATPTPIATPAGVVVRREPAASPQEQIVRGGTVYFPWSYEPPHFDVDQLLWAAARATWSLVSDPLVAWDLRPSVANANEVVIDEKLGLAERWEMSKDGLTYTFYIRKGVKWHNLGEMKGREFTADDVVWNIQRKMPRSGWQRPPHYASVDSARAVDKYTVEVKMKAPLAPFIAYQGTGYNHMMPKEQAFALGNVDGFGDLRSKEGVIGVGPFILKRYERGAELVFVRNPEYWNKELPYVDQLVMPIIEDVSTRIAAFRARKLDIVDPRFLTRAQAEAVKGSNPEATLGVNVPSGWWWWGPNASVKPFNDKRVRQAFQLAVDRRKINDSNFKGKGFLVTPLAQGFGRFAYPKPEALFGWEANDATVAKNKERAKQLLLDAGIAPGAKFTLLVNASYRESHEWSPILKEELRAYGIDLELKVVDTAVWLTAGGRGDFVLITGTSTAGGAGVDPDEYLSDWMWSQGSRNYGVWGGKASKEFDAMIEKQRTLLDEKERITLIHKMQEIMADESWVWPLVMDNNFYLVHPWVKGYQAHSLGGGTPNSVVLRYAWIDPKLRK